MGFFDSRIDCTNFYPEVCMVIKNALMFIVFCWAVTAIWSGIEKGLAEQALNNVP